jgi:hypothetical protein
MEYDAISIDEQLTAFQRTFLPPFQDPSTAIETPAPGNGGSKLLRNAGNSHPRRI